jgi:outer membrane protein OmpA-like peptidoglycan-associated protein
MKGVMTFIMVATALLAGQANAQESVRFIACPAYRDTDSGAKSGCWLATDPATGTRWDVSQSPYKPDWNFAVLVEGTTADPSAGQPCGAPVLDPVRTSRLQTHCAPRLLPAEGFSGRTFTLPARNTRPLTTTPAPPPGPVTDRTFSLFFEFDRSFTVYQYSDYLIDQAAQFIRATNPARLVITGYAASTPETVSGEVIAERADVAQERAAMVALSLSRQFPDLSMETRAETDAQVTNHPDADGIPGQSQRRVDIAVQF